MFNGPGVLAWEIPWTEESGGLHSPCGHKRVRHSLATKQQQDFTWKYFCLYKWWSHATCSPLRVDLLPCSSKSQLYREVLTIQRVSTSPQSLKTTSLKMAPFHREGPVGVHFKARGGWGASLSGPAPGSTCGHTLWMFRRYWWSVWELQHFRWGFAVSFGQAVGCCLGDLDWDNSPCHESLFTVWFSTRTLKDPSDWAEASGALPKNLLARKISSFLSSITLNLLNNLKQFQQNVCPSDPRAGRCLCASSASARSHVVLTIRHLLCILLTYVCICKWVCVLCLVAQSCLTLCNPLYCSLPGFSVHGDSPGQNTGVGCHAFLQGGLPNPGIELRSPTLQVDSLPSEPPGSEYMCMCVSMFICLWLKKCCF